MARPAIKNQEIVGQFLDDDRYKKNLLFCESWDQFYVYEDGWYKEIPTQAMLGTVWSFMMERYAKEMNITMNIVRDVFHLLKLAIRRRVSEIRTPYLAFEDCLYNLDTFAPEPFDRAKVALHKLRFKFGDLSQETPQWDRFLATTLVKKNGKPDEELRDLIQEMFGFYLLNDLRAHRVFFLVGQGANGKSVMIHVLEEMIGLEFVSAMSIQTLTMNQFATSGLIGKKINICNEEESKFLKSDRFKALISGDLIDAERKHELRFAFRPTTKYLFASNKMPTFDGLNFGTKRRMTIIPFHRIFQDTEQDKDLTKKLETELAGITKWAIAGAKALVEHRYVFTKTKATRESEEDFENEISSPILFFRETHRVDPTGVFISNPILYKEYTEWCLMNGKKAMSSYAFHKELTQNLGMRSFVQWTGETAERGRLLLPAILEEDEDEMTEAEKNMRKVFGPEHANPQ